MDWKRKLDDDPTKILETLRQAMKDLIEDAGGEKVREEELRGLSGYSGRRNAPPAYAAGIEDYNNNNNKKIIILHLREVTLLLLTEGLTDGGVVGVGHGEI